MSSQDPPRWGPLVVAIFSLLMVVYARFTTFEGRFAGWEPFVIATGIAAAIYCVGLYVRSLRHH
jgi:hypothetical protein